MAKITYTDKDSFGQPPQNMVYDTDMNQIKDGVNALYGNVETTLPEADATKAGERFWLNGTEWVYAYAGQFGSLAAGTPWPVKGYKELYVKINDDGTISDVKTVGFDESLLTSSRISTGTYQLLYDGELMQETTFDDGIYVTVAVQTFNSSVIEPDFEGVFTIKDAGGTLTNSRFIWIARVYP